MKFVIYRTSEIVPPCEEAKKETMKLLVDGDEEEIYTIEVNTLEELLNICKKYGDVIVNENYWDTKFPYIEIYDYYRE